MYLSAAQKKSLWTSPASVEGSTPTWTEGTPSFTESSSSGDVGTVILVLFIVSKITRKLFSYNFKKKIQRINIIC